jgi:hypothetical protein
MIRAFHRLMPDHTDDRPAMPGLLAARRRYLELRASLCCDSELDVDLRDELTAVISSLEAKIERLFPTGTSA